MSHPTRFPAAAIALVGLLAAAPIVLAQTVAPSQPDARSGHHAADSARHMRMDPTRHIEGRIAFLKAELKITPAQEPAFLPFAQAMRQNAAELGKIVEKRRERRDAIRAKEAIGERLRVSALERMQQRAEMSKARAEQNQRMLAAFKPLYEQLSDEQKKTADELIADRGGRHGGGHYRGHHRRA
jgi:protein CpxP